MKPLAYKNFEKGLNKEVSKGRITSFQFARVNHNDYSPLQWFYEIENGLSTSTFETIDISIMLKGKTFDNPPYIKL